MPVRCQEVFNVGGPSGPVEGNFGWPGPDSSGTLKCNFRKKHLVINLLALKS